MQSRSELSIFLSTIFFSIAAIFVKYVSFGFSGLFVTLFRFLIGIIFSVILIFLLKKSFKVYDRKRVILRGVFGAIAVILYYWSIQLTSSGRATLLNTTYPIFVAFFGLIFWKQKIRLKEILSIIVCFIGVIFVFYDGSNYPLFGNFIGLLSGVTASFAVHYIKRSRERNNPMIVYLSMCIFGLFISIFSVNEAVNLELGSLSMLVVIGITVFIAQMTMTYGFKDVSSTKGSIIAFAKIPITILLSYFLVAEEMNTKFIIGSILIIIGLLVNR